MSQGKGSPHSYRYRGQEHQGSRYSFSSFHARDKNTVEIIVSRYRPGQAATCYVNPADLEDAVLDRSVAPYGWPSLLVGLIPLIFFVVGASGTLAVVLQRWKRRHVG